MKQACYELINSIDFFILLLEISLISTDINKSSCIGHLPLEKIVMEDFYISAIKMDSTNQHIEFVKVHENKDDKIGPATVNLRAFVGQLISTGKVEFKTITWNKTTEKWSVGAKVEVMTDGYITTDPNKTKRDNLGNLPNFV